MEQIGAILGGKKPIEEPSEIRIIKHFMLEEFGEPCRVTIRSNAVVITVENGALASKLHMQIDRLYTLTKTDKKLIIRIGAF